MKLLLFKQQKNQTQRSPHCIKFWVSMLLFASLSFMLNPSTVFSQVKNKVVKGNVTNEKGIAIFGASVSVKGTTAGTNTDSKGDYSISVSSNAILIISYVGYDAKEVKIPATALNVNVQLQLSNKELDQVVVVGYGSQKKKDVTGAVITVTGATLQEVPTANLISELKGRAAGVDIVSNSSSPGGGGQIRIRGNRSLARSSGESDGLDQPLLVVDGIPFGGTVNDLNPDDILSLDILKDASATAIYGSRGSGGVILVTTKRGKVGKAITSYNAYYGTSKILDQLKVFNGPEFAAFKLEAAKPSGTSSYGLTPAEQAGVTNGTNTDWQSLIYKQGATTSNELSMSGGSESTQFGLGLGYYNETGIIPNQNFQRFTLRSTIDHRVNKSIKIGLNSLNTLSYRNSGGGDGVPGNLLRLSPLTEPYNTDGTINMNPLVGSTDAAFVNPLTLISRADAILAKTRRFRTFNSLYGEVNIMNGLKYRLNLGLDFSSNQNDNYSGPNTYVNTNTSLAAASATVGNSESWVYTIENLLTYEKTIAQKHKINFTGLFSTQKNHDKSSSFNATNFPADYIQNANLGLAANPITGSGGFSERGLISYMARLNYGYDSRLLLTATVRRDGASVLSPGNQYFTYPAIAVAWNIANEKFMQNSKIFNTLKLRGGWGKTSNQGVSPYTTLGALSTSTYNFGQGTAGQQAAYLVTTLANNSLHWESTAQWNVGIDFSILNSRITGSVDVYDQRTSDILLGLSLPPSNGASSTTVNAGKTKGHGVEITLGSVNIQNKNGFNWTTDVNFAISREAIVQLQNPTLMSDLANGWFVGQPLTVIFDIKKLGIWQTGEPGLVTQISPVQKPGQIKIEDFSGPAGIPDGKITADDRQIIGNYQPQWTGGMTNRFTYKGFDLSVVVFARMGMKVLVPYLSADGGAAGFPFFMQSRVNQLKVDYWTATNPTNAFPQPDASTDRFMYASTLAYQDGSFIKVRSINLGYVVPSKLLTKAGISSLRLYVTASNPFILYSPFVKAGFGPDPEGNGYGGSVTSALVGGSTPTGSRQISVNANSPSTRQFSIGVNLKF